MVRGIEGGFKITLQGFEGEAGNGNGLVSGKSWSSISATLMKVQNVYSSESLLLLDTRKSSSSHLGI